MIDIDRIIYALNSSSTSDLLLKKDKFLNSVMEDYLYAQFNELEESNKFQSWEEIAKYTYGTLYKKLQEINQEYGKIIVDYFEANLRKYYRVPEHVKFLIEDSEIEITPDTSKDEDKDESEAVNLNPHDTQRLIEYINHANLKNVLVTGGALLNWDLMFAEIKEDLDVLDENIYKYTDAFIKNALLMAYSQLPMPDMNGVAMAGSEQVIIENQDSIIVKIKGMNYVIVCHEMLKGVYDIFNEHSYPRDLDIYSQKYLRKITSSFYLEQWGWMFSRYLFDVHINQKYDHVEDYQKYLFNIFKMNYAELTKFLTEF